VHIKEEKEMNRRQFLLRSALAGMTVVRRSKSARLLAALGSEVFFARVTGETTPIFKLEEGRYVEFRPCRVFLYKNALLRLTLACDGMARIVDDPEPGTLHGYLPWRNYDQVDEAFVRVGDVAGVSDFAPISLYQDTKPENKLVVVSLNEKLVAGFEDERLVFVVPTVVGKAANGESATPHGFGHIVSAYTTVAMGDYPGVPFPMYLWIVNKKFGGQAFHGSYWWNWDSLNRGSWDSHGCINLPVPSKYDVMCSGRRMGFDQFFFKWVRTNLRFDPYTEEGRQEDPSSYSGTSNWFTGERVMRVVVIYAWGDLDDYPDKDGRYHQWGVQISQLEQRGGLVRLPDTDVNGGLSFRDKTAGDLS
jgi:hypothetical protein